MARRYYRRRGSSSYGRDVGRDRALQHIREAEALSRELGGTDSDVKEYFFNLTPAQLEPILDEYERQHDTLARRYAEQTIPKWKSGQRKMSGMVASRLFKLLPHYMPVERKYSLVKSLWKHCCPRSSRDVFVGPDAQHLEVAELVKQHFHEMVQNYKIDDSIVIRFDWLADGDVELRQQLYNYFLQLEREVLTTGLEDRVPILLSQLNEARSGTQRIDQQIKIGNHEVRLHFAPSYRGISDNEPTGLANLDPLYGRFLDAFIKIGIFAVAVYVLTKIAAVEASSQFSERVRSLFYNSTIEALLPWMSIFAILLPPYVYCATPCLLVRALVATAKKEKIGERRSCWLLFLGYFSLAALFYSFSDFSN